MVIVFVLFISKKLINTKKRSSYHSVKANSVDEIMRSGTAKALPTE